MAKTTKILIVKPRGLGDVVLSTIVLKNLKANFDNVTIDYLTEKFAKPVLLFNPYINQIFTFPDNFFELIKLIKVLFNKNYDYIFDFYSNPRTAFLTFLIRGKVKLGYDKRGRRYAYDVKVRMEDPNLHSALAHIEFLKKIKLKIESEEILYYITNEEIEFAKNFFKNNSLSNNYVAIVPGGGWSSKRCEPKKFVEFCKAINKKFNYKFLILYGDDDSKDAEEIYTSIPEISHLAGKTSIRQMVALISQCKATIANDSGPMHLSAAIKVPTLGIFGPTNPYAHAPFGKNCSFVRKDDLECIQCNLLVCPRNHECMLELDANEVVNEFSKIVLHNRYEN